MKQAFQSLKNGTISVDDVPSPAVKSGHILIRTNKSLISSGTERTLLEFGKSNYLGKALQQPEKVKQAIDKIKVDGLVATYNSISNKLNEPVQLGYCNVGKVIQVGNNVEGFKIGDRVISNGNHAEIVNVPKNLCAKIPKNVSDNEAVFAVIGAIALHGIRLSKPTIGEKFAVIGLGLIGLLSLQILKSHGCKAVGFDYDQERLNLAKSIGFDTVNLSKKDNIDSIVKSHTKGVSFDGSIIAASTDTREPIDLASNITRKKGRIILVGVADINISRDIFYHKELKFQVSCSYGPGRYDIEYEEKGKDYPIEYVRWTEQRNFQTILELLEDKSIITSNLISHEFNIDNAAKAYEVITNKEKSLGIIINYSSKKDDDLIKNTEINLKKNINEKIDINKINLGFIGAGNHAKVLIPIFKKNKVILKKISSEKGISSFHLGKKEDFEIATSNNETILNDKNINTVIICTQHDTHASIVIESLEKDKHIFVEKPLALNQEDLNKIESKIKKSNKMLTVGFNRRFSPHIIKMKSLIKDNKSPKSIVMNINAGSLEKNHWLKDESKGGGRLIGEASHFIDLLRHIIESKIINWNKIYLGNEKESFSIQIKFAEGSIGIINYFANGHKSLQKERIELFVDNKILFLNNYKSLKGYGWKNFKSFSTWKQDKGQEKLIKFFLESILKNEEPIIPYNQLIEVCSVAIQINED
tara:strand:+ start:2931 stop:5033 length:2103 start_codon:yes stop_codon:yes gene_type:complete